MAICVFLGHDRIYDLDVYDRTMAAVESVVQQEDEIEFMFSSYARHKAFARIGLWAACKARQRYPDKHITISIVKKHEEKDDFIRQLAENRAALPSCFVDRVIAPPFIQAPESKKNDCTFVLRRIRHWEMSHATYLISYLYRTLDTSENRLYQTAKLHGATIQDVINPETAAFIFDIIECLTPRREFILREYIAGKSRKAIGEHLNITASRVRQESHKATRAIQVYLEQRVHQQSREAGLTHTHICCFPLVDEIADYAMAPLCNAIRYLVENRLVTRFVILQEYPALERVNALQDIVQQFAESWCPVETQITEPAATTAQMLETVKALIEQSDFCICDLAATEYAEEIRGYAARARRAVLMDIGSQAKGSTYRIR